MLLHSCFQLYLPVILTKPYSEWDERKWDSQKERGFIT